MFCLKRSYPFIWIIILCSCLILSACGKNKKSETAPNSTCRDFDSYTKEYFDTQIKNNGLNLHFLLNNDSAYSDAKMSLGDYSYENMKGSQPFCIEQLNSLKKFDYNALSPSRQLTYDILMDYFKTELDFSDLCLCVEDLSPTIGIQAQLPVIFSEYEFHNVADIKNYLLLLQSIADYYKQICEFQKLKAKNDCFISSGSCDAIIKQCLDFINSENIKANLLYTSFQSRITHCDFLSDRQKASFEKQNESIIFKNVFPAYHIIIDTLTSLKEQGFCKNDHGLFYLKNGKDYYEYLAKSYTGSSLTVPEIKSMIQNQVVSDMKQLYSLISLDPELENKLSGVQFKMNASQILSDLNARCAKDFTKLDYLKYSLKNIDKSLQDSLSPAFFIAPPLDNPNDNVIYINPKKTTTDLYTVLAHEGIPGHMYQNAFFSSTSPDKIRYLIDCGGYSEGWAVYAEILSYKYQYDDETLAHAMGYNASYSLAIYCLCDIGVNYEGWTLFELQSFLENYNIEDKDVCKNIFQTVTSEPANYLKYYVGYLEIMKVKKYVMQNAGADFDLKKFHNALLSIGPASFDVVSKWIMYFYNIQ